MTTLLFVSIAFNIIFVALLIGAFKEHVETEQIIDGIKRDKRDLLNDLSRREIELKKKQDILDKMAALVNPTPNQ